MSTTTQRPASRGAAAKRPAAPYGGVPFVAIQIDPPIGERSGKTRVHILPSSSKKVFASATKVFEYIKGSTVIERHRLVSHGLPKKALEDAIAWFDEIPKQVVLDAIGISQKTVDRKETNEPLNPQHSNTLFSLLEVSSLAESTLGSKQLAEQWLNTPAIGLDGAKPISLLGTGPGVEAVKDLLARIEYGVYA